MSLTEREKEIALRVFTYHMNLIQEKQRLIDVAGAIEKVHMMFDDFLSRIREEQEAVAHDDPRADDIVSGLYRKFKEWSKRRFTEDDVTWCEVKGEINRLISIKFTTPLEAPEPNKWDKAPVLRWEGDVLMLFSFPIAYVRHLSSGGVIWHLNTPTPQHMGNAMDSILARRAAEKALGFPEWLIIEEM